MGRHLTISRLCLTLPPLFPLRPLPDSMKNTMHRFSPPRESSLRAGPLSKIPTQQILPTYSSSTSNPLKVPGESPAYYCSDPCDDLYQIRRFYFTSINVRMYVPHTHASKTPTPLTPTSFRVSTTSQPVPSAPCTASTGDFPWLNITGSINGRPALENPFSRIGVRSRHRFPASGLVRCLGRRWSGIGQVRDAPHELH